MESKINTVTLSGEVSDTPTPISGNDQKYMFTLKVCLDENKFFIPVVCEGEAKSYIDEHISCGMDVTVFGQLQSYVKNSVIIFANKIEIGGLIWI